MKIKEISFKNKRHRWELEKTKFSDLTLLVGASGVGKTQILHSIMKLKNISNGSVYNGVEWNFLFTTDEGEEYRWTGEFENKKEIKQLEFTKEEISETGRLKQNPRLLNEKLYLANKLVFKRKESDLKYEGNDVPKISPHQSVLSFFTSENKIVPVKEAFDKIVFLDYNAEQKVIIHIDFFKKIREEIKETSESLKETNDDMNKALKSQLAKNLSHDKKSEILKNINSIKSSPLYVIKNIHMPIIAKLAFTWFSNREVFAEIIDEFKNIFPQVEDVRFELLEKYDLYELEIKERGTDWISQGEISSGMIKSLMHISEMRLLAEGSTILIDEFENSLGVNCIDAVAGDLVHPERNLQYIITSHHPYIINNIDMKYWKVVMRKGANVYTRNAAQLKLGKSKHEAFKQLLNLEEFAEGIS
jgi:ABC-type dipeptide/oligopeptide/nickel transport system ATPase component